MLGVLVAAEMVAGSNLEGNSSLANFANFALYKKKKLRSKSQNKPIYKLFLWMKMWLDQVELRLFSTNGIFEPINGIWRSLREHSGEPSRGAPRHHGAEL